MSNKKKNTSKKNNRQGRPQGYVPPRLAHVKSEYEDGGVRIANMPAAVDYLDLMDMVGGLTFTPRLLDLPIYRLTDAAFREAQDVLSLDIVSGDLGYAVKDLPSSAGVVLIDNPKRDGWCGFAWSVRDGLLFAEMLTSRKGGTERIASVDATNELPTVPMLSSTDTVVTYEATALPTGVQPAFRLTRLLVHTVLLRLILGVEVREETTVGAVRGVANASSSKTLHHFEVLSTPEETEIREERAGGTHASPSHSYWRKAHQRRLRNGEVATIPGTWCCTDKPRRAQRERITGTTVRAGLAA